MLLDSSATEEHILRLTNAQSSGVEASHVWWMCGLTSGVPLRVCTVLPENESPLARYLELKVRGRSDQGVGHTIRTKHNACMNLLKFDVHYCYAIVFVRKAINVSS